MAQEFSRASKAVLGLIAVTTVLRLLTMALMGLGMDESYSTAISRDLHLSYFDHPPMHQWLAHAAGEVFGYGCWTRLPFVALFAGSTWLMFRLGARLFGERAGAWAALGLNLTAFFGVAAGGWVLPDGPLVFFELGAALVLARILFPAEGEADKPWLYWPLAGLWLGMAALSKYQALPVALGFGLALLSLPEGRRRLAHPAPWIGAVAALAVASPVIVWNAEHQWVSFAFQGGRGAARKLAPFAPLTSLLGQLGLLLPWVAVPLIYSGIGAAKAGRNDAPRWFCLVSGLPTILLFTLLPLLGSKGLPHWPMPGWLLLFPLLGRYLAQAEGNGRRWPRRWAWISGGLLALLWGVAVSDAATDWIKDLAPRMKTSPTYEAIDWRRLRTDLDARGLLKPGMFVVAAEWNEAGKIDQAVGDAAPVLVFNADPREYGFRTPSRLFLGHDALIIGRGPTVAQELAGIAPHFASLKPIEGFSVGRGSRAEIPITVIVAHDLKTPYQLPSWADR